jgi:hypothetical protein
MVSAPLDAGIGAVCGASLALEDGKSLGAYRNGRMGLLRPTIAWQWRKMNASLHPTLLHRRLVKRPLKA